MALIAGFTRLICLRCAAMTSRAETLRVWMSVTTSRADMKHRSLAGAGASGAASAGAARANKCNGSVTPPTAAADPSTFKNSRRSIFMLSAADVVRVAQSYDYAAKMPNKNPDWAALLRQKTARAVASHWAD